MEAASQAARRSARQAVLVFLVAMLGDLGFRVSRGALSEGRWETALPAIGGILAAVFLLSSSFFARREAAGLSPEQRETYHLAVQRRLGICATIVRLGAIAVLAVDAAAAFL